MIVTSPMEKLENALRQNRLVRIIEQFGEEHAEIHLKDLVVDEVGPGREIVVNGRRVVNFGSDSFLGLDQDPRVQESIRRGLTRWGSHNGASRAFASVRANIEAEEKLADWLGIESVLIYPSVTLANMGAIPGLVGRQDVIVLDEHAHNSMQEAAKIARADGVKVAIFSHNDPSSLRRTLEGLRPYRCALVCIDGVYSMSGEIPPMAELDETARSLDAVLYIDDAHGTGVLGEDGRGTVLEALGSYENAIVVGSLSKAFSCAGGFVGCSRAFQRLLKIRSNPYIFGGPVVPPYLEAIGTVVDILRSADYAPLRDQLVAHVERLTTGLTALGYSVIGGVTPIVSVPIGDEADTLFAGKFLFDQGYYVQSVLFPAVPYHGGVLRVQCNANHSPESVDGLLAAFAALSSKNPS
ncbi:aminotransferase class I/II-fold pyridoxal phosphate-dependent enzyme [Singulisphaera rosea]